jgi:fatty acid desaturase
MPSSAKADGNRRQVPGAPHADLGDSHRDPSYRSYHLQHHKFTQQPEDPDLSLSAPFPITKESYPQGDPRSYRTDVCEAAAAAVPVAVQAQKRGRHEMSHESFVSSGADKMARFLCLNAVAVRTVLAGRRRHLVLGVWVFAMATWLPLVTRIRNIAEHACTSTGEDPFSQARTTLANPIERLLHRALLGELPRRASFVHVSAVLPAARGASPA